VFLADSCGESNLKLKKMEIVARPAFSLRMISQQLSGMRNSILLGGGAGSAQIASM
jgi:hypothetical protein